MKRRWSTLHVAQPGRARRTLSAERSRLAREWNGATSLLLSSAMDEASAQDDAIRSICVYTSRVCGLVVGAEVPEIPDEEVEKEKWIKIHSMIQRATETGSLKP